MSLLCKQYVKIGHSLGNFSLIRYILLNTRFLSLVTLAHFIYLCNLAGI